MGTYYRAINERVVQLMYALVHCIKTLSYLIRCCIFIDHHCSPMLFTTPCQFRRIYGLYPEQIQTLGKRFPLPAALLFLPTHSFKTLPAGTFNSLDAVGTSRYQARIIKEAEALFEAIVQRVNRGGCSKTEEMAKSAIDRNLFQRLSCRGLSQTA